MKLIKWRKKKEETRTTSQQDLATYFDELVRAKPIQVQPIQTPSLLEQPSQPLHEASNFEKIVNDLKRSIEESIKSLSSEINENLEKRISSIEETLQEIKTAYTPQYPPFAQIGYVPKSIEEIVSLFSLSSIAILQDNEVVKSFGDIDEKALKISYTELARENDLVMLSRENNYTYIIRLDKYLIICQCTQHFEQSTLNFLREMVKRYISEVLTS